MKTQEFAETLMLLTLLNKKVCSKACNLYTTIWGGACLELEEN